MTVAVVVGTDGLTGLVDGEAAVTPSSNAGELKGDSSVGSGRGTEVGDLMVESAMGAGTVVGLSKVSTPSMTIEGKDEAECGPSA